MSGYDYMRGAMDAQFVQDMTGGPNDGIVAQMQARINELVENSHKWEAHYKALAAKLEETEKALLEEQIGSSAVNAKSNTIVREAELCREIPVIKPVFCALGEENRNERLRLERALAEEARRSGKQPKEGGLTREELLQYHKARSEGIEKPDFNR